MNYFKNAEGVPTFTKNEREVLIVGLLGLMMDWPGPQPGVPEVEEVVSKDFEQRLAKIMPEPGTDADLLPQKEVASLLIKMVQWAEADR